MGNTYSHKTGAEYFAMAWSELTSVKPSQIA